MELTELIKNMHESPTQENSKKFAEQFLELVNENAQVYTAVKPQGSGYAIDTQEHSGSFYVIMFSDKDMAKPQEGSKLATIGLSNLIDSCYSNPHIMGIAINPYDSSPMFIQRKDLQILSGKDDPRLKERDWGEGIPEYTDADLMVAEEALDFAMEIVAKEGLVPGGFELIESNNGLTTFPNFVVKQGNELFFVAVDVALAPKVPKLMPEVKERITKIGKDYNAKVLYAPVSFTSKDEQRAANSIALVGDEFIGQFLGFVELKDQ